MNVIKKIKRKFIDILLQYFEKLNRIDENVEVHPSAYIRQSKLYGNIKVAEGVKLYKVEISGNVEIGRYTSLWGPGIFVLSGINSIKIGNFCSIARNLTIQEFYHDHKKLTTYFIGRNIFGNNIKSEIISKGSVEIGHDVWIGVNTTIMSGVKVGNGAVIGAGSIVTKNIPAFAIVGGNPAKIIKYRFNKERIDEIENMKWWDWSIDTIKDNKALFN